MTGDGNQSNKSNSIFVHGLPYMILDSTRSKCYSVIAPHNQIIKVEFEAPDLVIAENMVEATRRAEEEAKAEVQKQKDKFPTPEEEGMDSMWNKRMKERMERIKSKKLRDTTISVSQKGASVKFIAKSEQTTTYDQDDNPIISGNGLVREELTHKKGRIEFMTGNDSGTVEICVQSIIASTKKPTRVHIKVDMLADDEEYNDDEYGGEYSEEQQAKDPDHLEHKELASKMSRLERDMKTLNNRVKAALNNADFNKDQETIFHEQSISMNRASKYWPIIQLIVLIITGFTQANHIVRYLKSHHIGGY